MNRQYYLFLGVCLTILSMSIPVWGQDSIPTYTSQRDTLCVGDTCWVIHTVCAPICSSCVRVINKDGKSIYTLQPPICTPFPEAYIQDSQIHWRDNISQLLDSEEKKLLQDSIH